jgi:hypothetical protein
VGQFFLSYARADQAFALRLATDLRFAGCPVWVDQFDILPSQLWDRTVEAAVRDCIGLILILSPRSVASENVLDEVSVALDSGKRIIPVLFEKCALPLRLARVQFIDATRDYGAALERCKAAVLGMPSRSPAPPPSPEPLPEPSTAEPGPDWHPEVIERAERNLAPYVGPIAAILVQKAARQVTTESGLYAQLAAAIPHAAERERFLKRTRQEQQGGPEEVAAAPSAQVDFEPGFIDRVAAAVTVHLGPLARHIVLREQRGAADREELYQRLGARIPKDRERAELLRKLRALQ